MICVRQTYTVLIDNDNDNDNDNDFIFSSSDPSWGMRATLCYIVKCNTNKYSKWYERNNVKEFYEYA